MKFIIIFFFVFSHGYSDSALSFSKCSIKDSECQLKFFQNVGWSYAPVGIPKIGVPPLDPFHLQNVTVPIFDMLFLTLVDGYCLGIGTCTVLKYETNLDNFYKTAEIICDRIVIEGTYTILSDPFFQNIGNVHGSGKGSIVLVNWFFKFKYPFKFIKRKDGEIYIQIKSEEAVWESVVLKNITITADNIMMDDQDITTDTLAYMNENWESLQAAFGQSFHAISVGWYFKMYDKFFSDIPTSSYLNDDLSPYVNQNKV